MVNALLDGLRAIQARSLTTLCACPKFNRAEPLVYKLVVLSMRCRLGASRTFSFGVRS